jgi:hypothetical protein
VAVACNAYHHTSFWIPWAEEDPERHMYERERGCITCLNPSTGLMIRPNLLGYDDGLMICEKLSSINARTYLRKIIPKKEKRY